jgi:uncharacterized protein YjbJ (UPF0337 family)
LKDAVVGVLSVWHGICKRDGVTLAAGKTADHHARPHRRTLMNWDTIKGEWMQVKGKVKEKWGKLTDNDLEVVAGKKDQLVGLLQKRYGYAKDKAEKEVDEFCRGC